MIYSEKKLEDVTFSDWWALFPGSYLCALDPKNGQKAGIIPSDELKNNNTEEAAYVFMEKYNKLNQDGYNIHFTPNGVVKASEKNRAENFAHVNALFVDIDIEETKKIEGVHGGLQRRTELKDELLGRIFDCDFHFPTFTVETRNGFQLIWCLLGEISAEEFTQMETQLVALYQGDPACTHLTSLLRVPYFRYYKNGETGLISLVPHYCSLAMYTRMEIWEKLPSYSPSVQIPEEKIFTIKEFIPTATIWDKIKEIPIKDLLERLSGDSFVEGQVFTFRKTGAAKHNVFANGQATPNWVDESRNMIFSNNLSRFCNIFHFLDFYGHTRQESKDYICKLLNMSPE